VALASGRGRAARFGFLALLFGIPRSPRWSASRDRIDDALAVLKMMGNRTRRRTGRHSRRAGAGARYPARAGVSLEVSLPSVFGYSIGAFNQLAGINSILYYANSIFASADSARFPAISRPSPSALRIDLHNGWHVAIDKLGRKTMLLIGAAGHGNLPGGSGLAVQDELSSRGAGVVLVAYIAFFSVSQGGDLGVYRRGVSDSVRSKGQGVGSASHWFMNAAIQLAFPL